MGVNEWGGGEKFSTLAARRLRTSRQSNARIGARDDAHSAWLARLQFLNTLRANSERVWERDELGQHQASHQNGSAIQPAGAQPRTERHGHQRSCQGDWTPKNALLSQIQDHV